MWTMSYDKNRFTHNYHGIGTHKLNYNHMLQVDFIGPLNEFKQQYACHRVDICTGLGKVKSGSRPDKN